MNAVPGSQNATTLRRAGLWEQGLCVLQQQKCCIAAKFWCKCICSAPEKMTPGGVFRIATFFRIPYGSICNVSDSREEHQCVIIS